MGVSVCANEFWYITSHRNQQLEDREGAVGLHDDTGPWQEWLITDAGHGKYFITSDFNQQLEDRYGTVGLHDDKSAYQEWKIVSKRSSLSFSSCFMTNSGIRNYIMKLNYHKRNYSCYKTTL